MFQNYGCGSVTLCLYPKPPSGAATGWGRFFCWGESAAAGGCGGVKTPPYGAKDTWAVMARWRAGHARPLRTAVKIYAREGQGRAAALPLCSGRVVAREWMATQGPSESPSHLTVTAPFDKGAFFPCGGSGNSRLKSGGRGGGVKNGQ